MTKLYLIRHAEAEGNIYRRMHGQYNSRITPNGLRQIEALADDRKRGFLVQSDRISDHTAPPKGLRFLRPAV